MAIANMPTLDDSSKHIPPTPVSIASFTDLEGLAARATAAQTTSSDPVVPMNMFDELIEIDPDELERYLRQLNEEPVDQGDSPNVGLAVGDFESGREEAQHVNESISNDSTLTASSKRKSSSEKECSSKKARNQSPAAPGPSKVGTKGKAPSTDKSPVPGRGEIRSSTNPEFVPGAKNKCKNPFFETMPAQEVWHRRMPALFPFGETPFIERELSRQIDEDLKKEGDGSKLSKHKSGKAPQKDAAQEFQPHQSRWALPLVGLKEVDAIVEILTRSVRKQKVMPDKPTSSSPSGVKPLDIVDTAMSDAV